MARPLKSVALLSALLALAASAAWGQPIGYVALAEGKVSLVRGAAAHVAVEGIRTLEGDIFATDAKSQAQVQLNDGTLLGLGPGTRLMLVVAPTARGAKGDTEIALLAGWVKLTQNAQAKNLRILTPAALAALDGATAVMRVGPGTFEAFVESGVMRIADRGDKGKAGVARTVKGGEAIAYKNRQTAVTARPARDFIEAMPRNFRDPLPPLPDKLKERKVEPKREREVAYADVEDWLKANLAVRKGFVRRFHSRTNDPQFRGALIANLREHPEWDRVLFPEKYEAEAAKAAAEAKTR